VDTQGILYIATGGKYIRAGIRSAESVRAHCPDLPTHLYADWKQHGFDFHESPYPFTSVEHIDDPHRRSKVDYMSRTPFDRTLYLDTDTALQADIRGMFELLDRFDIALVHAHRRNAPARLKDWRVRLPAAFPQFNSGVVLYRRTPAVTELLDSWRRAFHEAGLAQDQVTLRELLWSSDLRIATLPPEYNVRFIKYHFLWSREEATTQIFHRRRFHDGRFWFLRKWVRVVGRSFVRRGIDPRKWLRASGR
jgi:hypothetical protein